MEMLEKWRVHWWRTHWSLCCECVDQDCLRVDCWLTLEWRLRGPFIGALGVTWSVTCSTVPWKWPQFLDSCVRWCFLQVFSSFFSKLACHWLRSWILSARPIAQSSCVRSAYLCLLACPRCLCLLSWSALSMRMWPLCISRYFWCFLVPDVVKTFLLPK